MKGLEWVLVWKSLRLGQQNTEVSSPQGWNTPGWAKVWVLSAHTTSLFLFSSLNPKPRALKFLPFPHPPSSPRLTTQNSRPFDWSKNLEQNNPMKKDPRLSHFSIWVPLVLPRWVWGVPVNFALLD